MSAITSNTKEERKPVDRFELIARKFENDTTYDIRSVIHDVRAAERNLITLLRKTEPKKEESKPWWMNPEN